jgi:hypothetical protein
MSDSLTGQAKRAQKLLLERVLRATLAADLIEGCHELTPFREKAREVARRIEKAYDWGTWYQHMEHHSDGVYSATWWKRLVDDGPWEGDSASKIAFIP